MRGALTFKGEPIIWDEPVPFERVFIPPDPRKLDEAGLRLWTYLMGAEAMAALWWTLEARDLLSWMRHREEAMSR